MKRGARKTYASTSARMSAERRYTVMRRFVGAFKNAWKAERWWTAPGRVLEGQSDPEMENGQSLCICPSAPYDILERPKNAIAVKESSVRNVVIFFAGCTIGSIIALLL